MPTLERAVEMGQKRNMVKAIMEGTEETRAAGKWSPWEAFFSSILRYVNRVTDTEGESTPTPPLKKYYFFNPYFVHLGPKGSQMVKKPGLTILVSFGPLWKLVKPTMFG